MPTSAGKRRKDLKDLKYIPESWNIIILEAVRRSMENPCTNHPYSIFQLSGVHDKPQMKSFVTAPWSLPTVSIIVPFFGLTSFSVRIPEPQKRNYKVGFRVLVFRGTTSIELGHATIHSYKHDEDS